MCSSDLVERRFAADGPDRLWFTDITQHRAADGWVNLFNGQNLDGWEQHSGVAKYRVEDGAIVGQTVATEITLAETPWVQDGMIDVAKIALVPGEVQLESVFTVTETATTRRLRGNGIPNHPIGTFPIPQTSAAYAYYAALPAQGYANAAEIPVAPYDLRADLPMDPVMSTEPFCIPALMTGIVLAAIAQMRAQGLDPEAELRAKVQAFRAAIVDQETRIGQTSAD